MSSHKHCNAFNDFFSNHESLPPLSEKRLTSEMRRYIEKLNGGASAKPPIVKRTKIYVDDFKEL